MISPQTYRDMHKKDSLVHLKLERVRLEREIDGLQKEIETNAIPKVIRIPSRETRLRMKKEYLVEINDLIAKRKKCFRKRIRKKRMDEE